MSKIAKSSFTVTVFTLLGLGLSFLSNVVIAAAFGAGRDMDVFLAATAFPLFITNILSGSLNFTFIPVFAEHKAKDPSETWKMVSSFINLSALAALAACLVGMLFARPIMGLIAPGFTPDELARSAELLRWLLPVMIFTAINELTASVYYSNHRFVIPSLNKIIAPVITMAYVLLFRHTLSTKSIALAMLTASFIQTSLLTLGFLKDREFRYFPSFSLRHEGVRETLRLLFPLIAGMLVYRAAPLFDQFFLSRLGEGGISHVGYASKLLAVIVTVVITGISTAIFPRMAAYAAKNELDHLKAVIGKGIRMLTFLAVPFIVILAVFGKPVIGLLFQRGHFYPSDTAAVHAALILYLLSLPVTAALGPMVAQGFYVLRKNKQIAAIGVAGVPVYIALCWLLIKPLDYLAVPAAYTLDCIFQTILSTAVLSRTLPGVARGFLGYTARAGIIAAAACAVFYPVMRAGAGAPAKVIAAGAAFAGYFALAALFRVEEARLIRELLAGKFGRLFRPS